MKVSVIIPTLNEENYVDGLLSDLKKQSLKPFEVIVVDANSVDKTRQIVKQYKIVTLVSGKSPVASQRNLGAKTATGGLLIFLDADVRVNSDFIVQIHNQFENKNIDVACPAYMPYQSTLLLKAIYIFFDSLFILFQKVFPSGAGACIVCRKDIFFQERGFRKEFKFEDIEMIRRYSYKFRFKMLRCIVYVSDRRFKKEGTIKLFLKYLILSLFFITNQFHLANRVEYQFGKYHKNTV